MGQLGRRALLALWVALGAATLAAACEDASVVVCAGGERIVGAVTFCWYAGARPGGGLLCPVGAPAQVVLDDGIACATSSDVTVGDVRDELCTRLGVSCGPQDAGLDAGPDGGHDAGADGGGDVGADGRADTSLEGGPADSGPDALDAAVACAAGSCLIDGDCVAADASHPEDPCLRCAPDTALGAWSRTCASVTETSFEDFRDGTMPGSLAHLYASASGDVRWVQTRDLDRDGWADLVVSNYQSGVVTEIQSYLYFGTPAGFSTTRRDELDTVAATGNAIADLDQDGWPDVVFACGPNSRGSPTPSLLYWGSDEGFSRSRRQLLLDLVDPTGAAVGDLDRDGWLDVVVVERHGGAYVFPGSAAGVSGTWSASLGPSAGYGVTVADLDEDGWLDVVVAGESPAVYWGSAEGLPSGEVTTLEAASASSLVEAADLDGDGQLDLVFSRHWSATARYVTRSPIVWGRGGRSFEAGPLLDTHGALGVCIADLDRDALLDLVLTGYGDQILGEVAGTYVYRASAEGYSVEDRVELPSHASFGCDVVDYDLDGYLDLFVANNALGSTFVTTSDVFYGGASGFDDRVTSLPTNGAAIGTSDDLGNVYDRRSEEQYVSSAIDLGHGARALRLTWTAETPGNSSIELQLRSAASTAALASAPWLGPATGTDTYTTPGTAVNRAHTSHRYFQYRAVFRSPGFRAIPILGSVTLYEG